MRLLFSSLSDSIGGVETFILGFCKWLRKTNNDVEFITSSKNMSFKDELEDIGCKINIVNINRRSNPFFYTLKLRKHFKSHKYDIFYYNTISCSYIDILKASKKFGLKTVAHSHNSALKGNSIISKILHYINKGKMSELVDLPLACSDLAGEWLFNRKNLKRNIVMIPNGINLKLFKYNPKLMEKYKNNYLISQEKKIIGHIGSFTYQKNQLFLIDILKNLDKRYILFLIGDGPDKSMLTDYAKENNLLDRIYFTGIVNNVYDILNLMDIFVFPSFFEGLPIAVIEAQANGLPCIVSDTITKQCNIGENYLVKSLSDGVDNWSIAISELVSCGRADNYSKLKNAGFDSDDAYQCIYDNLENLINV